MSGRDPAAFRRYLEAKRTVDDRAMNGHVLARLADELASTTPLRVLELGAGIGTMIPRLLDLDGLPAAVHYDAVDRDPGLLAAVPDVLAATPGVTVDRADGDVIQVTHDAGPRARVDLIEADARDALDRGGRGYDLVIAAAFMDLVDIPDLLPGLCSRLRSGGLAYFPITFDGATTLAPRIDPALDDRILDRYHASMWHTGTDRAGRALLRALPDAGASVLAVGGADWTVVPGRDGYPGDEAAFLSHLVDTIHRELDGHPDLDDSSLAAWIERRHTQISAGELVLVAHNIDVLAGRDAAE